MTDVQPQSTTPSGDGQTPETNSRFKRLADGQITETIADQIQVFEDPTTQESRVIFNLLDYLNIAGSYVTLGAQYTRLEVTLTDKMNMTFGDAPAYANVDMFDPFNPNINLKEVSLAGTALLIKMATDKFHNLDAAAKAALIAAQEALAAAEQAATAQRAAYQTALASVSDAVSSPALDGTEADFDVTLDGLTATFTSRSLAGDGLTLDSEIYWFMNDGKNFFTTPTAEFTYAAPGDYSAMLVVKDSGGVKVKELKAVTVT